MRNKKHVQLTLGQIEAVQQSFIQFIRNTSLSEGERIFLEKQIEVSKQAFEQIRTFLNQEEEEYNTASFPNPQDNINYGIKSGRF
jgi:uncharacterized membrane protein YgaE (UPF0421/DUF939 family)